jgi:hypothetical protein
VTAGLRLSSRARGVTQRANGAWILVIDVDGRRYPPSPASGDVPLDVPLAPGESRATTRRFLVPVGAHPAGLITGHGGSYCGAMSFLVIGDAGCLFGKPDFVDIRPSLVR